MDEFLQNLAHFTHGMTFMFFTMMSLHLYKSRNKNRILHILYGVMVFWVFIELKDLSYLFQGVWSNPYLAHIHLSIDMWCVPAVIILLFEVISPAWVSYQRIAFVFLPSVLLTLLYFVTSNEVFYTILVFYSNSIGIIALAIVLVATSRHNRFIKRNFSNIDNINLQWVRQLIVLLYFLLIVWTLIHRGNSWLGDTVFYLFQIAMWMSFYYYVRKHNIVGSPKLAELLSLRETQKNGEKPEQTNGKYDSSERFINELKKIMDEEKAFLDSNLNITNLAIRIGTNRTYLSDCLNNILQTNFYDYINTYRIKEACQLMQDSEHKTLEEIAELSGFNSISTFRRAFSKNMKQNPAEYKKSVQ